MTRSKRNKRVERAKKCPCCGYGDNPEGATNCVVCGYGIGR